MFGRLVCMYVCLYAYMFVCTYGSDSMYVCVYITIRCLSVGDGYGHRNSDCFIVLGHPDYDPGLERQKQAAYSEE